MIMIVIKIVLVMILRIVIIIITMIAIIMTIATIHIYEEYVYGGFLKWGRFKRENPIKMDDLGVPPFMETSTAGSLPGGCRSRSAGLHLAATLRGWVLQNVGPVRECKVGLHRWFNYGLMVYGRYIHGGFRE